MKSKKPNVIIMPIAGCDEIGMNLMLYNYNGTCIMVDCGIGFPEQRIMPGVDICVPNLPLLKEKNIKVDALIITHAHEDHLGAICYLWEDLKDVKIYATPFAANLIYAKALDFGIANDMKIVQILPTKPVFNVGNFVIEAVGLTHSVLEMKGLFIKAGHHTIFHTGDWKFDKNPVMGDLTDMTRLQEIGEEGVSVLLCDSTNIFNQEPSGSEGDLFQSFCEIMSKCKGRIVVTIFASNVARIQTISEVAKRLGRSLVVSGTALHRIIGVAQRSGYLKDLEYFDMKEASTIPRQETLVIATGCQGEPLGSVAKLSSHNHPLLKLSAGDTVVFSSKPLPPNLKKISNTINRFIRLGVDVVTDKTALTHVSGHPSMPEVKQLYQLLRPKIAIPVHGEALHLKEHCRLARDVFKVPFVHCINNGEVLEVDHDDKGVKKVGEISLDALGVDGYIFRSAGEGVMRERRRVMQDGAVCVSLALNKKGGIVIFPELAFFGFIEPDDYDGLSDVLKKDVARVVQESLSNLGKDGISKKIKNDLIAKITQKLKAKIKNKTTKSPLIKVLINIV